MRDLLSSPAVWAVVLGTAGVALSLWLRAPVPPEALTQGPHRVMAVSPAGTLRLENGAEVVLLGVEPVPGTVDALRQRLEGQTVVLRFERRRKDAGGRFLAFVYTGSSHLNETLLDEGLARVGPDGPSDSRLKRRFRQLEEQAQRERRGIWGVD